MSEMDQGRGTESLVSSIFIDADGAGPVNESPSFYGAGTMEGQDKSAGTGRNISCQTHHWNPV